MIRVVLPAHLRTLAQLHGEVEFEIAGTPTIAAVVDEIEQQYPTLRGTIRDTATGRRRPMVRFFACEADLSHEPLDAPLPGRVADGSEPLLIIGAMAGG